MSKQENANYDIPRLGVDGIIGCKIVVKSTKKHRKCLQKVQLRVALHFANKYSYRKHVSI